MRRLLVLAAAAAVVCSAAASAAPDAITGRYLLSFLACDPSGGRQCNDPRNHRVYLAQSDDGAAWSLVPGWQPYAGSVPDVFRRGDTVYVYTPRFVARYRLSTGTLEQPVAVQVTGLDSAGFVDPSVIQDADGRLVLFFLPGVQGRDPASCLPDENPCVKRFRSATEVAGSDGTRFTLDDGVRAEYTIPDGIPSSDPDVFKAGSTYVLYVTHGETIVPYTSPTLRGSYSQGAPLNDRTGGIPSGYFDAASGRFWTYAHVRVGGRQVIRRAVHADLVHPLTESDWTTVLTGAGVGLGSRVDVESPGFAVDEPGIALATQSAGSDSGGTSPSAKKKAATAKKRPLCRKGQRSTKKKPCRKR
ncbi:MAG TPA: hypothetical protein VFJ91_06885 [Gaiellaceae bacterium]|nr:hypothetical protein [Gaiellaceae bacterium]